MISPSIRWFIYFTFAVDYTQYRQHFIHGSSACNALIDYIDKVTRIIHKLIKIHIFASKADSLIFFLPNIWRHARPLLIDAKFVYIENTRRNNVINSAIRMVLPLKRGHFTLIYTTGARLILFSADYFFYLLRWWRCHLFIFPSIKLLAYHQRRTINNTRQFKVGADDWRAKICNNVWNENGNEIDERNTCNVIKSTRSSWVDCIVSHILKIIIKIFLQTANAIKVCFVRCIMRSYVLDTHTKHTR